MEPLGRWLESTRLGLLHSELLWVNLIVRSDQRLGVGRSSSESCETVQRSATVRGFTKQMR